MIFIGSDDVWRLRYRHAGICLVNISGRGRLRSQDYIDVVMIKSMRMAYLLNILISVR
jgi:hypothetical protein